MTAIKPASSWIATRAFQFARTLKLPICIIYNRDVLWVCNQLQAGFLACALPRDSFPSGTKIYVVDSGYRFPDFFIREFTMCLLDFQFPPLRGKDYQLEQALTAARPPRILTAFPFDYPVANAAGPVGGLSCFQRAQIQLSDNPARVKWKKYFRFIRDC